MLNGHIPSSCETSITFILKLHKDQEDDKGKSEPISLINVNAEIVTKFFVSQHPTMSEEDNNAL